MKRAAIFLVLIAFLAGHVLFYYRALGWDAVDDAYISYVYARNAVLGHGLTFNPSERVEGFTNFLWTAMMTPIVGAGWDVGRVSSALGVAFAIGILALVRHLARLLALPSLVGWLTALFLVADGSFALWSVSGLETSLFAFLVTLGVFLYIQENIARAKHFGTQSSPKMLCRYALEFPASGVVLALAALTRPEAAAVFALTAAHQAAWRLIDQRRLATRGDVARVAAFSALFIPYWLVRWRYYHSFLPNSFYAKVAAGGPIAQIERGWNHVQQFVSVHLGWWILIPATVALGVALVDYSRARRLAATGDVGARPGRVFGFSYLALLILAYGAYIVYVGGDWSVGRFFVPILPFVYLLIASGLFEMVTVAWDWVVVKREARNGSAEPRAESIEPRGGKVRRSSFVVRRSSSVLLAVALLLALALAFTSSWNGEYKIFIGGFEAARATQARVTMGKWLKANVPRGTWIAVDAAGQVPYFSELPAIDMFGINDLHIGRMPVATLGQGTPGHEKFDLGYIIARAPRYVIIFGTLFDNVTEYRRAAVQWTTDEELSKFLTLYERR